MSGARAIFLLVGLWACGARSGLADGRDEGTLDASTTLDADVPDPPDAGGVLACDGLPLPRPGSVAAVATTGRSQGLGVLIPDPLGILVVGGLWDGGVPADQMAFLDLASGVSQELPVEGDAVALPLGTGAAVYVPNGDRVVVIGGSVGVERAPTDQVFVFVGEGDPTLRRVRVQLGPAFPDGPVRSLGAVYDPRANRIIVHGGTDLGGDPMVHRATWALALDGGPRWEPLLSASEGPAAGTRAMGYDPVGHRAIEVTDDEDGEGLAVYALSLERGSERWQRLGPIDFSPSVAGELIWDERACGFHLLSARRTRCVLEHWVLTVEGDEVQTVYRGELDLDPGHFLGAAMFVRARSELVLHSSENCQSVGHPNPVSHEVSLVR